MKGEARSNWEHSTAPVKAIRFSITLRTLKDQANKTTNKNNTISTQGL
jgi:hypothetical protein